MNKKRSHHFILLFICMLLFSSCNIGNSALDAVSPGFKDGVYTGYGDPWEYGNESAVVTVLDHRIYSVTLHKHDVDGSEVDYELWDGLHERPNLKEYRLSMAKEMLDAQSSNIPNMPGAAFSSENWKLAFSRAISNATT